MNNVKNGVDNVVNGVFALKLHDFLYQWDDLLQLRLVQELDDEYLMNLVESNFPERVHFDLLELLF